MTVATYHYHEQQAQAAFAAHKALVLMEVASPELVENQTWCAMRRAAFEHFTSVFERIPERPQ